MEIDFYDDDLPAPTRTWAESFQENKDFIKLAAKVMWIPVTGFAMSCVFNYYVNNKL
jgi:hypothetical protein